MYFLLNLQVKLILCIRLNTECPVCQRIRGGVASAAPGQPQHEAVGNGEGGGRRHRGEPQGNIPSGVRTGGGCDEQHREEVS